MKLGIIRCMQTEDYCPGSRDFRTIRERKGAFMGEDDIQLVGFINCGGCPEKKSGVTSPFSGRTGCRHHCLCFLYQQRDSHWLPLSFC